jgi:probable HAF family extracellular repeat protein
MSKILATIVGGVLATALPASAATIQFIPNTLATDLSQDGSVLVGNLPNSFETFRWTQATGVVPLGRATVPTIGIGAGSPDVSYDGTKVSATILSDSGTQAVAGQWTLGSGWQQLGPLPANSVPSGADVADAWGMSGNGTTVVGLFWTTASRAHAYRWTSAAGMVDLGAATNQSSRASAVNYDGSVVVGFDAHPSGFPNRTPAVWVNGVKTILGTGVVDSELKSVNADGTIVGGSWRDASDPVRGAALWRFDGTNWNLQKLGVLPGTAPDTPGAIVDDMSADGSIVVGFNRFDNSSFNSSTGFYWSAATGMISANQLISNLGLTLPSGFQVLELTSVSPDGSTIAGIGFDGSGNTSFIIAVPEPTTGLAMLCVAIPLMARARRRRRA